VAQDAHKECKCAERSADGSDNVMGALHPHPVALSAGRIHPALTKKPPESKEEKSAESPPASPMEYTIIAEKNILHPERKIPVDKPEAPLFQSLILYSTDINRR